jgi:hypothetical protein
MRRSEVKSEALLAGAGDEQQAACGPQQLHDSIDRVLIGLGQ